jgi:putative acetyltransferase
VDSGTRDVALVVGPADPASAEARVLLDAHLALMRVTSPPEDVHALDLAGLLAPEISFFGLRSAGALVAVGAVKRLDASHAELKSMHTAEAARGRGAGRALLEHLVATARSWGCTGLSLETGSTAAFAPARSLYVSAGFVECGPFGDYAPSPHSTFMALDLASRPR